ncbi:MAG: hypothetical protein CR982_00310 [Candidatus Cloacimonadota bacterium]|nr:MAG: hypothetical protein CR982_00310 [Candidatus Cloacimonadota bacterium]PIE79148.1 MAG: hypothetical protein CSA15_04555 [Candidatus Delongbacteria bacterium]
MGNIKEIMDNYIYEDSNCSSDSNCEKIITLFNILEIDISDYNEVSENYIDLTPYYKNKISKILTSYSIKFQSTIFEEFKNEDISKKKKFYDKLNYYKGSHGINKNSVKFDTSKYINDLLKKLFERTINLEELKENYSINLDDIYSKNLNELKNRVRNKYKPYLSTLLKENENKSLIYFNDELETLERKLEKLYSQSINSNKDVKYGNINIDINGNYVKDFTYEDLLSECELDNKEYKIEKSKISVLFNRKTGGGKRGSSSNFSIPRNGEVYGFIGELYVYNILKKEYKNIEWVSSNAKKANIISEGDDSRGFDISYLDNDNKIHYIEVKSTNRDNPVFQISKGEVKFGEQNSDVYDIIFITNVNQKYRKLYRIEKPFKYKKGENFYNNSKFSVENNNFKIVFKLE